MKQKRPKVKKGIMSLLKPERPKAKNYTDQQVASWHVEGLGTQIGKIHPSKSNKPCRVVERVRSLAHHDPASLV